MLHESNRRSFLKKLATATGAVALAPIASACGSEDVQPAPGAETSSGSELTQTVDPLAVPNAKPDAWDAVAWNRERGNAGAIPDSYLEAINGADGETMHLGKHLPYVPALAAGAVPAGHVAIMWGDPSKGHARHPNAAPGPDNGGEGHWYDWIRVRKATEGEAEERESRFAAWPGTASEGFVASDGGDVASDSGKNTVYLVALPADVAPGDVVRVYAHCLTHGEYVDFVTLPV
jgi:hypothetical protein